ncbi:hypothetical protein OH77DRAFT_1427636, partial [Trametes cingulata]
MPATLRSRALVESTIIYYSSGYCTAISSHLRIHVHTHLRSRAFSVTRSLLCLPCASVPAVARLRAAAFEWGSIVLGLTDCAPPRTA